LMVPVPAPLVSLAAAAIGLRGIASRLTESLQLDVTKTRALLGWMPRENVNEGLRQTARAFQRRDLYLDRQARSA